MENARPLPVLTPSDEPYLGRELLFHFDQLISSCLEQNAITAPRSHASAITTYQAMAGQVIPQGISIALSIRELIRQGYLFGAHVLVRPLAERAMILLYLLEFPQKITAWERGWRHNEAPSLAKMFEAVQAHTGGQVTSRGHELTAHLNSLLHGRPDSAHWNLVDAGGRPGFSPSKILDRAELCDEVCANTIPWLAIVQAMMGAYFPDAPA